jgi:O-antigen/teichoic acid export membrane protein
MGQALFSFLAYAAASVRQSGVALRMAVIESATETSSSIVFVLVGAGAAGAALGKSIGYAIATTAGLYLMARLLGTLWEQERTRSKVRAREVLKYAGATFIVDLGWTVIIRVDILLIGALLTSAAVGTFNAVLRIVTVLGYLGTAVAGGVAPRLSLGDGSPDTYAFNQGVRYLLIVQGLVLAPMIVWATPLVDLLLGPGYHQAAVIMQVLSVTAFVSAPAGLLSVSVNYLGAAQRRVKVIFVTLVLGIVSTYVLIDVSGLVGAAIADDLVGLVYVVANLWLCTTLIAVDVASLVASVARIVIAASAMAVVMFIVGTDDLSPAQWLVGGVAGAAAYAGALFISGEISVLELQLVAAKTLGAVRPAKA